MNLIKKNMLAAAVAMCGVLSAFAAWDGSSASWTKGAGTEADPYLIENEQNFAYLAEQVNSGNTLADKFFKITADLDMGMSEGRTFPKIGNFDTYTTGESQTLVDNSIAFMGVLDGDFHVIDNILVEYYDEELGGTGLFAVTREGTVLRNIVLGANSAVKGEIVCGSFVGEMIGGLVENCENRASVNGNMFTGGFVGCMEGGKVANCVNNGAVVGATEVGGIVGQGAGNGVVDHCYNTAKIKAEGFGGAGIGGALYDRFAISNCYSIGAVSGQSNPFMGSPCAIVSDAFATNKVTNCYFVMELTGYGDTRATAKSADEMKSAEVISLLNNGAEAFVADTDNRNGGFPVLAWQSKVAGVESVTADMPAVSVIGNVVSCDEHMEIYSVNGALVAKGYSAVLPAGIYIVKAGNAASKFAIK